MNAVVDPTNDAGDLEGLEKSLTEAVTSQTAADKATEAAPEASDDSDALPEKYKGKSIHDVIEMHQNLESKTGRMANDLGQQRKLTDKLLDLKRTDDLTSNTPEPLPELSASDLLDKPQETLDRYIAAREERIRKEYDERLTSMENGLAQERFVAKHPDYTEVSNDPKFGEWISASAIRSQAVQQALAGDYSIADALLSEFKARGKEAGPNVDAASAEAKDAARQASLTTASADAASGSQASGKVYRRSDLIRLKLEKPSVYEDPGFQAEILRAYQEGRVK